MSRPLPSSYQPQSPDTIGAVVEIGTTAEDKLADNVHHCYGAWMPTLISTIFSSDSEGSAGVQPYIVGRNIISKEVNALWDIDLPLAPVVSLTITVLYETTSADAHTIRFDWASDPWVAGPSGTFREIPALGSSGQWTVATGTIALPGGADDDTLRMWVINSGASGEVRVHSVDVQSAGLASIPAGAETEGTLTFYPLDTDELDQDSPLTVAHRQALWDDCEFIRRTRPGHPIGWSENTHFRAGEEAYGEAGSAYVRIITIPIAVPLGCTLLRWSLFGYRSGSAGSVSLTTLTAAVADVAVQEAALDAGWTSPYSDNLHRYDDGGLSALAVTPPDDPASPENWAEEVRIELKGDGATARLMGLCLWFAPEVTYSEVVIDPGEGVTYVGASSQRAQIPDGTSMDIDVLTEPYSWSFWCEPVTTGGIQYIMDKSSGTNGWYLATGAYWELAMGDGTAMRRMRVEGGGSDSPATGAYVHICFTYDGSGSNPGTTNQTGQAVKAYIDGVEVGLKNRFGPHTWLADSAAAQKLTIGTNFGGGSALNAKLFDLRIYKGAELSASEVADIHTAAGGTDAGPTPTHRWTAVQSIPTALTSGDGYTDVGSTGVDSDSVTGTPTTVAYP